MTRAQPLNVVSAFTPGPWHFRLEAVRTVIYHKADMGERAIAVGAGHYPDHVANARLIAAAPELYEALDALLRDQISIRKGQGITAPEQRAFAVLAKARGETVSA